jgi:phage terminase large subunit GpA-like protein
VDSGIAHATAELPASPALQLLVEVRAGYRPPPDLRVSEFCDRELVVTAGPLAGTRWSTDFAPYQRGILDVFHEPGVEISVVMGSSQWGKTACAVNICAYHIAHDPGPILVVEPTVDPMAKDFAKNRLDPLIRSSAVLAAAVDKKRARDASNTTLQKTFKGGALAIGGANSASSLASRSVRLLILDEVDRYPAELPGEGSTMSIALARTKAFRRRRRIALYSSPTLVGGTIDVWHKRGDQRRFYVPCPACDFMHPFEWRQVRWDSGEGWHDPSSARLHCPACDHPISDAERVAILDRGEWRPEHPGRADKSIVSFHLWEAYSPLSSLEEIVKGFLQARELQKAGDKAEMHTWQNTTLGEPVEPDQGDGVKHHVLLARRELYPEGVDLPAGVLLLTAGIDVQDDRLEAYVYGWGEGEEAWLVDRHTFPGSTDTAAPWDELEELLAQPYSHQAGDPMGIQASCIDSAGHRTTVVYGFGQKHAGKRLYVTIGRAGQVPLISSPSRRPWKKGAPPLPLYTIGVDAGKSLFLSRLKLTEAGPGFVHLPIADWADEEMCEQLTAEALVTKWKKGLPVPTWVQLRPRNEALDCAVLALAACRLANPNWAALRARLGAKKPPEGPKPTATRRPWLGRRGGGWLSRNR